MATAAQTQRRPVRPVRPEVKANLFVWEGMDRAGKKVRGEMRAASEAVVSNSLRRQSVKVLKIKKQTFKGGGSIKEKEIALFTRQLATMTRAGVPLLQSFDIAARSTGNNRLSRLLLEVKGDIESGNSLAASFKRHPVQFDELYCNLVGAGEQAGILDAILDRLAVYKEKTLAHRWPPRPNTLPPCWGGGFKGSDPLLSKITF